jgi:hypothetical protein
MDINCNFSEPLKADGVPPNLNSQEWEFSKMNCLMPDFPTSSTSTLPAYISEIISTSTPEKNFYLSKTIDLGQILFLGFFLLFFLFAIVFSIKKLVFKKS